MEKEPKDRWYIGAVIIPIASALITGPITCHMGSVNSAEIIKSEQLCSYSITQVNIFHTLITELPQKPDGVIHTPAEPPIKMPHGTERDSSGIDTLINNLVQCFCDTQAILTIHLEEQANNKSDCHVVPKRLQVGHTFFDPGSSIYLNVHDITNNIIKGDIGFGNSSSENFDATGSFEKTFLIEDKKYTVIISSFDNINKATTYHLLIYRNPENE